MWTGKLSLSQSNLDWNIPVWEKKKNSIAFCAVGLFCWRCTLCIGFIAPCSCFLSSTWSILRSHIQPHRYWASDQCSKVARVHVLSIWLVKCLMAYSSGLTSVKNVEFQAAGPMIAASAITCQSQLLPACNSTPCRRQAGQPAPFP